MIKTLTIGLPAYLSTASFPHSLLSTCPIALSLCPAKFCNWSCNPPIIIMDPTDYNTLFLEAMKCEPRSPKILGGLGSRMQSSFCVYEGPFSYNIVHRLNHISQLIQ